ncbi:hypothetical protein OH76DRAFT_1359800 [Lentinus brumalis]|uniref:Uncharacterized protein n=1 Tax=Lentinus brumalis TaxID=2498619 RepID=A0A371CVP7_9APHY|nr:hypothetical protein OH76DRAFT_1359800 [Polyporus brumalis]
MAVRHNLNDTHILTFDLSGVSALGSRGHAGQSGSSRQLTDMIMGLRTKLEAVEDKTLQMEGSIANLTRENRHMNKKIAELTSKNEELKIAIAECGSRVVHLEGVLEDLAEDLAGPVDGQGSQAAQISNTDPVELVKTSATLADMSTTDFFACMRAVMQGLMGIDKKDPPPKPMKQGYWSTPDPAHPNRLLRPRWEEGWESNRVAWGSDAVQKVKADARRFSSVLSQEMLDALPEDVIMKGINTTFNTHLKNWKAINDSTAADRKLKAQKARRHTRKGKKALERYKYRQAVPELCTPEFSFIFQARYQSTDESDDEEDASALDPNTDVEGDATTKARKKRQRDRPWVQRTPAWRTAEVNGLLDRLDAAITAILDEKESTQGNSRHARVRGSARDAASTRLPDPFQRASKKEKNDDEDGIPGGPFRIPLSMVNREWLDGPHGSRYRSAAYIHEWASGGQQEVAVGGQHGDGGEEEEQG